MFRSVKIEKMPLPPMLDFNDTRDNLEYDGRP
jgi:hypothetical protein